MKHRCCICGAQIRLPYLRRHLESHRRPALRSLRHAIGDLRRGFAVNGVIEEPDVIRDLDGLNMAIALIKNPCPFKGMSTDPCFLKLEELKELERMIKAGCARCQRSDVLL